MTTSKKWRTMKKPFKLQRKSTNKTRHSKGLPTSSLETETVKKRRTNWPTSRYSIKQNDRREKMRKSTRNTWNNNWLRRVRTTISMWTCSNKNSWINWRRRDRATRKKLMKVSIWEIWLIRLCRDLGIWRWNNLRMSLNHSKQSKSHHLPTTDRSRSTRSQTKRKRKRRKTRNLTKRRRSEKSSDSWKTWNSR